jgi:PAS domain S-box-containing protein
MPGTALTSKFYASIVKHGSDLISVIGSDGIYRYVSDSVGPVLGYDSEELLGINVMTLIHEEDVPFAIETLRNILYEKQIAMPPFRFKARDGSWRWLSCVVSNMLDNPDVRGLVTNSRDITQEILDRQKKLESQAYYRALYVNNPDLVFTLNPTGYVEACNDVILETTGYTKDEASNRHFTSFVQPDYLQVTRQAFMKALYGQSSTFDCYIIRKQGDIRYLSITAVPVLVEGQVKAIQCIAKDTTSEKEANVLIKEQAVKLHNILESITDCFFALDSAWRYSFGNSMFARFLNRDIDDLLQKCIWEEYPYLVGSLFHKKCFEVIKSGESVLFDDYFPEIDTMLRFTIYPFEGGVSVAYRDITKETAVQEDVRRLSLVARKTNNGVIFTNKNNQVEWVNDALTAISGYSLEDIKGKQPGDIFVGPDTNMADVAVLRQRMEEGLPASQDILSYKKNGEEFWSVISISPVYNEQGDIMKFIHVLTDITERKKDQERLLKLTENLYLQNQDLQQFNYIVSHNLRAPVANLIGLSGMLQKIDRNSSRFGDGLQNLEKSARLLDGVIQDLNKILAIRNADTEDARELVNLKEVNEEVLQGLQHLLDKSEGSISVDISEEDKLWANRAYVHSILQNLVSNAIKYKSADRPLQLEIKSVKTDSCLSLIVKDNGSGMNLEQVRPQLFQLYKRFHTHREGKGIGLYLVKSQVEALGGQIDVESCPDKGTTFSLRFDRLLHDKEGIHN